MIRLLLLPLVLASVAAYARHPAPVPPPPEAAAMPRGLERPPSAEVRPIVASDSLQGRWSITAVDVQQPPAEMWLELEGLGTSSRSGNGVTFSSPGRRSQAYLGCNNWYPQGWARNGDKLTLGLAWSLMTERGCDSQTMAIETKASGILGRSMTMEFNTPARLRLVNEAGTLDLVRH